MGTARKPSGLVVSRRHETRHETAADLRLLFPSLSVKLVRNRGGRSAPLPTPCDACQKMISEYPFITKLGSSSHYRIYHVACALRIGVVTGIPSRQRQSPESRPQT
jgi:hypothetical protein